MSDPQRPCPIEPAGVVLFGVGSPLVVDLEESLARSGVRIAAAIHNIDGPCCLLDQRSVITPDQIDDDLRRLPCLIPLFTPAHRQSAARQAEDCGLRPAAWCDASVVLPRSVKLSAGAIIGVGCTLGACGDIGPFVFLNRGVSVGHHLRAESFVSIGPGAVLSGQVTVGRGAFIGANATILPQRTIGANAVVAAGAVVTSDVPEQCLVAGNPAVIKRESISGFGAQNVA